MSDIQSVDEILIDDEVQAFWQHAFMDGVANEQGGKVSGTDPWTRAYFRQWLNRREERIAIRAKLEEHEFINEAEDKGWNINTQTRVAELEQQLKTLDGQGNTNE